MPDIPSNPQSVSVPAIYQTAFNLIDQGFCLIEKVVADNGQPADFRYLLVNPAFEKHTGLQDVIGKTIRHLVPGVEESTMAIYNQVALTGQSAQFETYVAQLDLWIAANVFRISPQPAQIAVLFTNTTGRKQAEEIADAELHDTQLLQALSARLVSEENIQPIYDQILAAAIALTRADAGTVQIYEAQTKELVLLATSGFGREMTSYFHRVNADSHTSCGIALKTNRRTFTDFDESDSDESIRMHVQAGYLTAQSTPLLARSGAPIGMLNTHWHEPNHRPTERELRFLDLLARQAADLIEQRRAAERLRESNERISTLVALMPAAVYTCDARGRITFFNRRAAELWGREPKLGDDQDKFCGSFRMWLPDGTPLPHKDCPMADAVREGRAARNMEVVVEQPSGRRLVANVNIDPLYDRDGQLAGAINVFVDITEQKQAEQALRESEKKYRTLFENMGQGYALGEVIRDAEGNAIDLRYLELNPAFERLSGIPVAQAQGRTVREVYGTVEPEWFEVADRVARLKVPERVEYEIGAIGRWFQMHFYPAEGDRYLGLYEEVTERKRREAHLAFLAEVSQDLAHLTTIEETMKELGGKIGSHFQVSNVAFGEVDEPHEVMTVAHEWRAADARSFVGEYRISDFLDDDLLRTMRAGNVWVMSDVMNDVRANAEKIAALGIGAMASVPFARDSEWLFNLTLYNRQARYWREDEIDLLRELATHIWTRLERARAEEALRETQKRFESIANLVPDLLWDSEPDGSTNWYNQRWLDYTGQRFEEAIGWGWTDAIHPDDREASARRYGEAVAAGESLRQEYRIRRHDGVYRWFVVNASPLKDQTGQVVTMYGAATDIHETKRLEMTLLEADRRKDEFLAMLAHELRNPMSTIRSGLQVLTLTTSGDEESNREMVASTLDMMNRQTDHLVRMVDDLLDVSRISRDKIELKKERVNLVEIVNHAARSVEALYQQQGRNLQLSLPVAPIYIAGDATRLTQVVANLLTNGVRYTGPQGHVWLTLEHQHQEALIQVRDNGIGLADDQRSAIFELFVQVDNSLARSKGGLGIGLTLVKRLVELHDGQVAVRSKGLGQGSTFSVRLPTLEAAPQVIPTPKGENPGKGATSELILVIDDNADAALTLSMLLKLKGYQVHTCNSGQSGIEAAHELSPGAILLDLGMPGMDGYETCRLIRQQSWGQTVVVIAISGYGQEEDRQRTKETGFNGHLVKPVDLNELTNLLTKLLDAGRSLP